MKKVRLLLADDHDIVLEGLRRILDFPDFEIVGTAEDGRTLIQESKKHHPDVVITDITMPSLNGIDAARMIRKTQPKIKLVFLTMHPDIGYATEALTLGNCAYVLKSSAAQELSNAIRALMQGETYVASKIAEPVLESLRKQKPGQKMHSDLSGREREILQLIAEGQTFKQIASVLNISPRTVEFHRNRISDKTGQRTKAALTRYAVRIGIVAEKHHTAP